MTATPCAEAPSVAPFRWLSGASSPALRAAARARADVGLMVTPRTMSLRHQLDDFAGWAFDNCCYSPGREWSAGWWWERLEVVAELPGCLFATAPDVVADARATLERSLPWLERIRGAGLPAAFVLQDGCELGELVPWELLDWVFVGGSTEWKLSPAACELVAEARARGKGSHVGRVGTGVRLRWSALTCRADTADGTVLAHDPGRLPLILRELDGLRVPQLFGGER